MKITVFNGSPRAENGNTHAIVDAFLSGARDAGAETKEIFLVRKKIGYCRGCFSCWSRTPGTCILRDDMDDLLGELKSADVSVFATPLYVDNVTGIMKTFLDRILPLADPHFEKDPNGECRHLLRDDHAMLRKIAVISNCGFPEQSQFQVLRLYFRRVARNTRADIVGEIYRGAGELFNAKHPLVSVLLKRYRKRVAAAGREIVELGRISDATAAALEKPLIPDSFYIKGANRHWDRELKGPQP